MRININKKWKRVLKIIFWGWLISSLIFIGMIYYQLSIVPAQLYQKAQLSESYEAIIVPGVPFYEKNGKWSFIMKARVYWAYFLYKTGKAKNIIYSGGAVYSPYVEAQIMGLYGEKLGVDPKHIFTENRAEHSTENLYYSLLIAKEQGFKRIALATDPFQHRMLRKFAIEYGLSLDYIPIVFSKLQQMPQPDVVIDPSSACVSKENFIALPERESWSERMQGTRGEKILEDSRIPLMK